MVEVLPAHLGDDLEHVIKLSHEYVTWMLAEIPNWYPQLDLKLFASEHDYDDVRRKFPGEHVPPHGCLLLARAGAQVCGCIALGRLSETVCEVRTLYVRPDCRGLGVGKQLAQACLEEARRLGYRFARLDTLGFMHSAQSLYRSLGFYAIEPYLDLPSDLKQYIQFFEVDLAR